MDASEGGIKTGEKKKKTKMGEELTKSNLVPNLLKSSEMLKNFFLRKDGFSLSS